MKYVNSDEGEAIEDKESRKDDITFFLPLCGKSVDLVYLYEQGLKVIGCECSEVACEQLFTENKIPFNRTKVDEQFDCFQVCFIYLEPFCPINE